MEKWKKAIENYFYHYTIHTIIGILGLFFVISLSWTLIKGQIEKREEANRPPADIEILLYGDFKAQYEEDLLNENLAEIFPDWDIRLETEHVSSALTTPEDIASQQKGMLTMATIAPDVYIFDPRQFEIYVESNEFSQLDDVFETIDETYYVYYQTEDDTEEHVYGINITDSPIFELKEALAKDKYIVIRKDADNQEKIKIFIERIIDLIEP
ncbi:MAG TPA: hypothetical protein VK075_00780 [Pseudogracilibacillus sp.]|nr:hypothetical protein [Pseudogracilibacillus sp.]